MTKPNQPLFTRYPTPSNVKKIHLIGIAGAGMGAFACMLQDAGFEVRGSDQNVYPPMSDTLKAKNIPYHEGWQASNLDWQPDWVIVGNVCRRDHIEVLTAQERQIPYASFPQALHDLFLVHHSPIVIAGTHGKTTTTSLTAWLLADQGLDPGLLVGGISQNFNVPYLLGKGKPFVVEGDEYDTAFFDKGPKFLHYAPKTAVINNIEFDHADIYDDLDEIVENFERLCMLMTEETSLWVNADDPLVQKCSLKAKGKINLFACSNPKAHWQAINIEPNENGCSFDLICPLSLTPIHIQSPLAGKHNVYNTLVALGIACEYGVVLENAIDSLSRFKGVVKRQQVIGSHDGVLVIDDYAHHPTAIYETLMALKAKYPNRKVYACYEPKSNTARRNVHQKDYAHAFMPADVVFLARPFKKEDRFAPEERLNLDLLVSDLQAQGKTAEHFAEIDGLLEAICTHTKAEREKDALVVFMSSSSFEGAPIKLLAKIKG
jgi:UDP-N-acetylmuramate: L-alanyl-gamma-D-glutamyl-meso-diaminopimelate ligase